uniref:Uncharacterized protein n=1 Tax=Rhizophora mucronata TaxID=61149 RepID=A0A2P2PW36_RHIMU
MGKEFYEPLAWLHLDVCLQIFKTLSLDPLTFNTFIFSYFFYFIQ